MSVSVTLLVRSRHWKVLEAEIGPLSVYSKAMVLTALLYDHLTFKTQFRFHFSLEVP